MKYVDCGLTREKQGDWGIQSREERKTETRNRDREERGREEREDRKRAREGRKRHQAQRRDRERSIYVGCLRMEQQHQSGIPRHQHRGSYIEEQRRVLWREFQQEHCLLGPV